MLPLQGTSRPDVFPKGSHPGPIASATGPCRPPSTASRTRLDSPGGASGGQKGQGPRLSSQRGKRGAAMKLLLGTFLLAGVCWLGAAMRFTTMANFDKKKIAGNWYPLAIIVIEKPFPQYTLKATWRGLEYSFKYLENGKCRKRSVLFNKYRSPGHFKGMKGPNFVQILATDYTTYIISYIVRGMDSFVTLAGKEHSLSSDLEKKFKQFATSVGVTGEIVPVTRLETC